MTAQIKRNKGFTLIELLVVIGILAVLLAIVLIAINPARQFAQANDTKRRSDLNAILNSIHQYSVDNRGNLTALGLTVAPQYVSNDPTAVAWAPNICSNIVPTYIAALPTDPRWGRIGAALSNGAPVTNCTTTYNTGYVVSVTGAGTGRIAVSASAEMDLNQDGITNTTLVNLANPGTLDAISVLR